MWIVSLALRRPYTFVVAALLLLILGPIVIVRTPKDIFPTINIPVIGVIWNYNGLSAEEMTNRIVSNFERSLTTTVNDIEHIESQSLNGISVVKIFFYPTASIDLAMGQVTSISQVQLRQTPPGTTPPFMLVYNASSVPILQLALSSPTLTEQQLNDIGSTTMRTQLATVQGASLPNPYGGRQRQIMVDLDPIALRSKGLSPVDVVNAIGAQNLILPAGTAKIGNYEYTVDLNASPRTVDELNDFPVRTLGTSTIFVRDVAHVRDGSPPQTNIVHVDGRRSTLITVQKSGNASTLDIIQRVKAALPKVAAGLPADLEIRQFADQSIFVEAAIQGVLREAIIAACLTGAMILLFLGSWRSTLIISVSIPLSILSSLIVLSAIGETINIMTLGGLALAVGILVDDATVAIENIDRNLDDGKETEAAILDGAQQIAIPAFVSTISICIVFVPMFLLTGVARYLFVPLAEAVVFAMLASYILSRTLVPTMAKYLLKPHAAGEHAGEVHTWNPFVRIQRVFERLFERLRSAYCGILEGCLAHRAIFLFCFAVATAGSFGLAPWLGQDFFPAVDSGQIKLHFRAPTGTRIEETAALCERIETVIRGVIPAVELETVIDNIGLPSSGINLTYGTSAPIGPGDADILISLNERHKPTEQYVHDMRVRLVNAFPGVIFYFPPADMVTQILNFGLPAPIDVQVVGNKLDANRQFAAGLMNQLKQVPGIVDMRIQQPFDQPKLHLTVNRTKAAESGFTERDIAQSLLVSLSGSFQTSPSFWVDPKSGVSYSVATMTPQYNLNSLDQIAGIPVTAGPDVQPEILGDMATVSRTSSPALVSHYNVQPVVDIFGAVQRRDLGGVQHDMSAIIDRNMKDLPRGSQLIVRGQIETMISSFSGLLWGLLFAIVLDYFLIVVNFQSWRDPFIIIAALPAALAGIVWILFVTGTTLSVPALTGSIMCMGVATANSILVVSFARDRIAQGFSGAEAALESGFARFRPVLMTALAMIMGMIPMALGMGEGGEQNAPLGRAVIGGLLFATAATLFFVPVLFSLLHRRSEVHS